MKIRNPFSNINLSEKNRKWFFPFALIFFVVFYVNLEHTILYSSALQAVTINKDELFSSEKYAHYVKVIVVIVSVLSIYRISLAVYDFYRYNKISGNKISTNYLYWIMSGNILSILAYLGFAFIVALFFNLLLGWNINDVYEFITNGNSKIKQLYYVVPNIVQLPGVVAGVILFLVSSFLLYANHYLSHVSRFMWLLSHRPHHVTTALTNATGFLADMQFLIGWLVIIIELIIVLVLSRFITTNQEPVMFIFFGYAIFIKIFEVTNHAPTYYQFIKNSPVLNFICKMTSSGPYHVLHHSSKEEHSMVNLGGNSGIWDLIFGTYCDLPDEEPQFGLTNQPALELSAMAVVFGGLQQIWYELKHNKDFLTRIKIIFGGIYYIPPITKDYLKIKDGGYNVLLHKIQA